MAGIILDEAKVPLCEQRITSGPFGSSSFKMLLYVFPITLTHLTVLADFVVGSWLGYAPQSVSSWGVPALDPLSFQAISVANPVSFVNTGGSPTPLIYGWCLYDTVTLKGYLAGAFTVPFSIPAGGSFNLTPSWGVTGL